MAAAPPVLPPRFPCWCRAVYSWGGETKRDLGFVEGDLIECLNAGDGSWWMGRLRRDKRMMGLFPSNFVEVLPPDYRPPTGSLRGSINRPASPQPKIHKTKTFRKPFQAYSEVKGPSGPSDAAKPANTSQSTALVKKKSTFQKPFQAYAEASQPNPAAALRERQRTSLELVSRSSSADSRQKRVLRISSFDNRQASSQVPSRDGERNYSGPMPSSAVPRTYPSRTPSPNPQTMPVAAVPETSDRSPSPVPQNMQMVRYRPIHSSHSRSPSISTQAQTFQRSRSPCPQMDQSQGDDYHQRSPSFSRVDIPNEREYLSRTPSPAPPQMTGSNQYRPRTPSPAVGQDNGSPPPPVPPPHRVSYTPHPGRAPSPAAAEDPYATVSRTQSPAPSSMGGYNGQTPSPLRDAMEDVMTSLEGMQTRHDAAPPESPSMEPFNPWSPAAYDQISKRASSRVSMRAKTSLGIGSREGDEQYDDYNDGSMTQGYDKGDRGPPEMTNYVQRMESRLRQMQGQSLQSPQIPAHGTVDNPPEPPPKNSPYYSRSYSSVGRHGPSASAVEFNARLKNKISTWDIGRQSTIKSNTTNSSSGASSNTHSSVTSTKSAAGFSATSAASLARRASRFGSLRHVRPLSAFSHRGNDALNSSESSSRPLTPMTGYSWQSSHASKTGDSSQMQGGVDIPDTPGILGGLVAPKPKKSGFFKKIIESAKTGAASARSSIASGQQHSRQNSPTKAGLPHGMMAIAGGIDARTSGFRSGDHIDWMQVRRDVNRSNTISRNERIERRDRCQMLDHPAFDPVDALYQAAEGDESIDGLPVAEPTNFHGINLAMVDKNSRFVNNVPPMISPATLAQSHICRPFRSDVHRLRAIFTWVSEKIAWDEAFEGEIDTRRVIHTKRGCPEEVAVLVLQMCDAVGLHAEVVRGYLKTPGETLDFENAARPNHFWNAVLVEGEWRIMDCSLSSPTHPKRTLYSSAVSQAADGWYFLARPMEICYTHVPLLPEQQHICPPVTHDILMALPCSCPPFFKHGLQMHEYDTSLTYIEDLELMQIQFHVPADVECVADVEARAFEQDADGDYFENGDTTRKRALAQADWVGGQKRYTVKACLPGDEGQAVLKVYAGKKGLMHSVKDNPYPLAFALPINHTGHNPPYDFLIRHPTPHAQRHDLYVIQPQCFRLAVNNTYVFAVRQHPSSLTNFSPDFGRSASPMPLARPSSSLSVTPSTVSSSAYGSNNTDYFNVKPSLVSQYKPAKLAVQAPNGKILRLMRKADNSISTSGSGDETDGSIWETIIKIGERGVWRGLVLADRSARWCVFSEWECV